MKRLSKEITRYIAKTFLIRVLFLSIFVVGLFFMVEITDMLSEAKEKGFSAIIAIKIILLKLPRKFNETTPFIILLSTIFTYRKLSHNNEISVMRASGISAWQFLFPTILVSFLLGVFLIAIFNPLSSIANVRAERLTTIYIEKEVKDTISPSEGIWFKQDYINEETGELQGRIIIRAKKINKNTMEFDNVSMTFFDRNNYPFQKLNAENIILKKGFWEMYNIKVIRENEDIQKYETMVIKTNLKKDFVINKIENNFTKVESISFWKLPKFIKTLQASGFSSEKFKMYFNYLLKMPVLFVAMVLIASFFSLRNLRAGKDAMLLTLGIMTGILIYITSNIISAFGMSGRIPILVAAWFPTFIYLAIGVLLVMKREDG